MSVSVVFCPVPDLGRQRWPNLTAPCSGLCLYLYAYMHLTQWFSPLMRNALLTVDVQDASQIRICNRPEANSCSQSGRQGPVVNPFRRFGDVGVQGQSATSERAIGSHCRSCISKMLTCNIAYVRDSSPATWSVLAFWLHTVYTMNNSSLMWCVVLWTCGWPNQSPWRGGRIRALDTRQ